MWYLLRPVVHTHTRDNGAMVTVGTCKIVKNVIIDAGRILRRGYLRLLSGACVCFYRVGRGVLHTTANTAVSDTPAATRTCPADTRCGAVRDPTPAPRTDPPLAPRTAPHHENPQFLASHRSAPLRTAPLRTAPIRTTIAPVRKKVKKLKYQSKIYNFRLFFYKSDHS